MSAMSSAVFPAKARQHHLCSTEKIGCISSIDKGLVEEIDLYCTVMHSAQLCRINGCRSLSMESKCINRLQRSRKVTHSITHIRLRLPLSAFTLIRCIFERPTCLLTIERARSLRHSAFFEILLIYPFDYYVVLH